MTVGFSFRCPCGYCTHNMNAAHAHMDAGVPIDPDSCCNCSGRRCMDCVLRWQHDECEDSCPNCCGTA